MKMHQSDPQPAPAQTSNEKFSSNLYLNKNGEKFFESNFAEFNLPSDTVLINIFLSEFYFPEEFNYPLPNIQIYSQIAPVKLNIDYLTLLWLNTLFLALSTEIIPLVNELTAKTATTQTSTQLFDACVECILPKLNLKLYNSTVYNTNIPKYINILCSSLKLTNLCIDQEANLKLLCKKVYKKTNLCMSHEKWPIEPSDLLMIPTCLLDILNDMQNRSSYNASDDKIVSPKDGLLISILNKKDFKTSRISTLDLWLLNIENLWVDININQTKANVGPTSHENTVVMPTSFKLWFVNTGSYYNNKSTNEDSKPCLRFGQMKSSSHRSFNVEDINAGLKGRENFRRRTKSCERQQVYSQTSCKNKDVYNSKFNLICDINDVKVKVSHYQLLFLLRLVDEVNFFQKQLGEDAFKVVSNLNKDIGNDKQSMDSLLSVSVAVFIDKLEVKMILNDKRRFRNVIGERTADSFGRFKKKLYNPNP
jgi:hypothetical protein